MKCILKNGALFGSNISGISFLWQSIDRKYLEKKNGLKYEWNS